MRRSKTARFSGHPELQVSHAQAPCVSTTVHTMRTVTLTILLALFTGAAGWLLGTRQGLPGSTSDASTSKTAADDNDLPAGVPRTIRCQGKFEPASGLIKIVASPGERIVELIDKRVGEIVNRGEVLIQLQSQVIRENELALARARREDALRKSDFEKMQGGYKLESAKLAVEEANASDEKIASEAKKIILLQRQLAAAERLLTRLVNTRSNESTRELINQTDIDKQELMVEQLRLKIEQANLDIEMARKSASRAKNVAQNNLEIAKNSLANADEVIPLKSLNAAIKMAEQALELTQIGSPIDDATILDIIVRDSVANQPVMVLGDTSKMLCIAEVNDMFMHLIDLDKGDRLRAKMTSPALVEPLMGTVIAKGVMIGPPSLRDPNPFSSVDRRTGTVTIELDDSTRAARHVNLQVEVEIEVVPASLNE